MSSRFDIAPGVKAVTFDDETVVFNPASWETHVLNAGATLVLGLVQDGCTVAEVRSVLADALADEERSSAGEHADRVLGELQSLRLIVERDGNRDASLRDP
jgi:PqqD family protein of HPr-rel-A system